jgi:DNA-binding CsgD family transcriptional regulator
MLLSDQERDATFGICEQLLSARSEKQIASCVCGPLKELIGFKGVFGGLAECSPDGLAPSVVFARDFPEQYLSKITRHGRIRPQTLQFWAKERKPLALNFNQSDDVPVSDRVKSSASRFGFYNMLCHGQVDPSGTHISYVTLTQIDGVVSKNQQEIISFIMPHLHNALQLARNEQTTAMLRSSKLDITWADKYDDIDFNIGLKKKQVLYLIGLGKTNWEISQILGTSVDNVKYHVKRINEIFATNSRSSAVAEAIRRGAMPEDWPVEQAVA